jgi:predicted HicB family RNase H-like nuclease
MCVLRSRGNAVREQKKYHIVLIRIPEELHGTFVEAAQEDRRSVNQWAIVQLERATRARQEQQREQQESAKR